MSYAKGNGKKNLTACEVYAILVQKIGMRFLPTLRKGEK